MATNVENTLKRANELVFVGQKGQALALLFDLISNRRQHKRMWTKIHEDAMLLFVRLCVDLKDNRVAREGLISYRNIAQQQAPGSLEAVITFMLDLSDEKVSKAMEQCKSNRDVSRIVDDLEEGGTSPEAMLMATVASEKDRVRSEQAILVPWLKFAWENLRSVLETLRNNLGMEQTYHATAHRAFAFCKAYGRKLEFRRLCDLLRMHLQWQTKREGEEPSKLTGESMELHLGTRFEQLKVATSLHLWVDGFKTIEDIHNIISMSTKKPSVQLMATYYQKLTQMFLVSGSFLFHAFAFRMYYDISRERNKALTQDQIRTMASSVLLAAMSVPLPSVATGGFTVSSQNDSSMQKEKNRRMAQLLGFDQVNPDRETLLKAIRAGKVLEDCSQDARDLYNALELQATFDPQNLVKRCAPKIAAIRADPKLEPYAAPIERLLIIRLMSQLGRVFQSVRLSEFHAMIDELAGSLSRLDAEKLIVQAVRHHQIPLRHGSSDIKIDHLSGTIRFGENVLEEQRTRDALADLAKRLAVVAKDLKRGGSAAAPSKATVLTTPQTLARIADEQNKLLERKALIAQRRREMDELVAFRTRAREEREETERLLRAERDKARTLKIEAENKEKEAQKIARLKADEEASAILRAAGIELSTGVAELTPEERDRMLKEKQEKQLQQALEFEKKMQTRAKRLDGWIRASREAEKEALGRESARRKEIDREDFLKEAARALQTAQERHAEGLVLKESFQRIVPFRQSFEQMMNPIWTRNIEAARDRWIQEHEERRLAEKVERAMARRDEDMRRRRQEEEAARRAEMEAKRIREAEEELRKKEEARAEEAANPAPASSEGKYRPRMTMEATMDDNYQGRSRREGPPTAGVARSAPPTALGEAPSGGAGPKKGVYQPPFLRGGS